MPQTCPQPRPYMCEQLSPVPMHSDIHSLLFVRGRVASYAPAKCAAWPFRAPLRRALWSVSLASIAMTAQVVAAGAQTPVPPPRAADTTTQQDVGALRPGDALKIVVFRDKELSNEYPIDARGYVQI